MREYSNPRMHAVINQWPYGPHKTIAEFTIEQHPTRGERAVRVLINPRTGKYDKPKKLTYARQALIVNGDDNKTYILERSIYSSILSVMRGDMKHQEENIYLDDPRYITLLSFFE